MGNANYRFYSRVLFTFLYLVGWSDPSEQECSVECGTGVVVLVGQCKARDPDSGIDTILSESSCTGVKPSTTTTDECQGTGSDCGAERKFIFFTIFENKFQNKTKESRNSNGKLDDFNFF